jgi:hydroxyacylglutathione hydrolase
MLIRQVVDENLAQNAYVIGCQRTGEAIVIDPERDVDRYQALAEREGLRLVAVAETHIHADFLSGARELAACVPGLRVYLSGEGGPDWSYAWPEDDDVDVVFLRDGDTFSIGNIDIRAWHTPGHTPEHLSYVVTDRGGGATTPMGIATGDFVFVNDLGRPDLLESAVGVVGAMQEAAHRLYASARLLDAVDDHVQVWPGHGAGSACGKALGAVPTTTVGYERLTSPALRKVAEGEDAFVRHILADQPEPPLYFAAMKRLNKLGPPVLGTLPTPSRLGTAELVALSNRDDIQVVDTRADRRQFFEGHLAGSFHAPLTRAFPTVIGSLLDPDQAVVLIVGEDALDGAVRDLIRIGYDHVRGWAPLSALDALVAEGRTMQTIPSIDVAEFARRHASGPLHVLDVRGASEYAAGHLPGAMNIAHTRLRSRLDALPGGDGPLYVHCATGVRAAAAAALLAREGHAVVHVDGASTAWQPASTLAPR